MTYLSIIFNTHFWTETSQHSVSNRLWNDGQADGNTSHYVWDRLLGVVLRKPLQYRYSLLEYRELIIHWTTVTTTQNSIKGCSLQHAFPSRSVYDFATANHGRYRSPSIRLLAAGCKSAHRSCSSAIRVRLLTLPCASTSSRRSVYGIATANHVSPTPPPIVTDFLGFCLWSLLAEAAQLIRSTMVLD